MTKIIYKLLLLLENCVIDFFSFSFLIVFDLGLILFHLIWKEDVRSILNLIHIF